MLNKLKSFFAEVKDDTADKRERHMHLAAAVLLFEVAKADHVVEPEEEQQLQKVLREYWELDEDSLHDLLEVAASQSELNVSLHEQMEVINKHFSQQEKYELLCGLWSVALADQKAHHYEEHLIRRLADMLYLSHSQFIKAKCEVMDAVS